MTQLARSPVQHGLYSKGSHATTTAKFTENAEMAATAWQGVSKGPTVGRHEWHVVRSRSTSPTASTAVVVFMPSVDVSGSEVDLIGIVSEKDFQQQASSMATPSSVCEEPLYGVYAPTRPRRVLHSEVVTFKAEALRRRKPRITGDDGFLAVDHDD